MMPRIPLFFAAAFAFALVLAVCAPVSLRALQQQQNAIQVQLMGEVRRGDEAVSVESVRIMPGELLRWQLNVRNTSERAVSNVSTDGMVPRGTVYVAGSARAEGAALLFSIDGGRSFSPRPVVRVVVNGVEVERPADPVTYTNLRFVWSAPQPAGVTRSAHYQTRVR